MRLEDFNEFYEKVINKYIEELQEFDSSYKSLTVVKKASAKIYQFYEKKRIELRTSVMVDPNKPIDRHKTAATMMYAVLRAKVFKINYYIPNLPEPLSLANEYLACHVALNIVELYKRHDEKNSNKKEKNLNYLLDIPETKYESQMNTYTNVKGSSFISSLCLTLSKIVRIKECDVLAYATILFLLEERTDTILAYKEQIRGLEENGKTTIEEDERNEGCEYMVRKSYGDI